LSRKKKPLPPLPGLSSQAERRAHVELILGLTELYRGLLKRQGVKGNALVELVIFQVVLRNHLGGAYSNAHHISKLLGLPRMTVVRRLAKMVKVKLLAGYGSKYCIAKNIATRPADVARAYRKGTAMIHEASAALLK
jgi:hypothetical protein